METGKPPIVIIHGGYGKITRAGMTSEYETEVRSAIKRSLQAAHSYLSNGGSAIQAVAEALSLLEDHPLFNAGKGAVYTSDFTIELDAGVMDSSGNAGGVSSIRNVKNPIRLALEVALHSPHTVVVGGGAEEFARRRQLELSEPSYYATPHRLEEIRVFAGLKSPEVTGGGQTAVPINDSDTVGCVVLDCNGQLAAGNSTGGPAGKLPGRLSDACVPGCGYFADPKVAVSVTGIGDYFLKGCASHEVACMLKYGQHTIRSAAERLVYDIYDFCSAGCVVLDVDGNYTMPYNTEGMFRGVVDASGQPTVLVWDY